MTPKELAEDIISRMKSEMPYRLSDEIQPYFKEALTLMYKAAQPKWISAETPPEKEGAYLTFPHFTVLVYDNNDGEWDGNYWNNWDSYMDMVIKDNDVKFWMHLPNPPSHD